LSSNKLVILSKERILGIKGWKSKSARQESVAKHSRYGGLNQAWVPDNERIYHGMQEVET
jgi:hypothetical protein